MSPADSGDRPARKGPKGGRGGPPGRGKGAPPKRGAGGPPKRGTASSSSRSGDSRGRGKPGGTRGGDQPRTGWGKRSEGSAKRSDGSRKRSDGPAKGGRSTGRGKAPRPEGRDDGRPRRGGDRARAGRTGRDSGGRGFETAPDAEEPIRQIKGWGDLASKGASNIHREGPGKPKDRDVVDAAEEAVARGRADEAEEPQPWPGVLVDDLPEKPLPKVAKGQAKPAGRRPRPGPFDIDKPDLEKGRQLPPDVRRELAKSLTGSRLDRAAARLARAAESYERGRWLDAIKDLRWLTEHAPQSPAVRELHGLTLYQLGRWKAAAAQLEAFIEQTGDLVQHPVLADCYRGLGWHAKVAGVWEELRVSSPDAATVIEGRIVAAGSLADQGQLIPAITMLESGPISPKRPKEHHLRLWYALADLYERAGEVQRARDLFERIHRADPAFVDIDDRLENLG